MLLWTIKTWKMEAYITFHFHTHGLGKMVHLFQSLMPISRWERSIKRVHRCIPRPNLFQDMESIKSILTKDELDQFEPHAMQLKRGECVFHHPLVVHGSFANQSDRPRRAAVINYFGDGTISNTDQPLMEGIPVISKGQYLKGKFFPLLGKGQN